MMAMQGELEKMTQSPLHIYTITRQKDGVMVQGHIHNCQATIYKIILSTKYLK